MKMSNKALRTSLCLLMTVLLLAALSVPALAMEESPGFTFRGGIKFGMTMDEVKDLETGDNSYTGEDYIFYFDQVQSNRTITLGYHFSPLDKLLENISVSLEDKLDGVDAYVTDFDSVDQSMSGSFENAGFEKYLSWSDGTEGKQNADEYKEALVRGDVTIISSWSGDGVEIYHLLSCYDNSYSHMIMYYPEGSI